MKNLLLLLVLSLVTAYGNAQEFEGTITDQNSNPIAYGLVHAAQYSIHTHSDNRGRFRLSNVKIGDTLEISHLSYETQIHIIEAYEPTTIKMEDSSISIDGIVISNDIASTDILSDLDISIKPVNSTQDILTKVPGLLIGQHAGGGKAEQIFLRGFDIDHGTDITITADGIPVNMVSHAHGQGYADLHFIIPETVEKIDFGLGPYYANRGNFNTAGYVDFATKKNLDNNQIKLEVGQNQTRRLLSMFKILDQEKTKAYVAGEYLLSNGPFISPQNFSRANVLGNFSSDLSKSSSLNVSLSHFTSSWDASGQIPQRAVDNGSISRFGAIDDTEGGYTSRSNFIMDYKKFLSSNSIIKSKIYLSNYNFELFSNFTFFLEDEENGDQILQKENRYLYGLNTEYSRSISSSRFQAHFDIGLDLRIDESRDNQLANTLNRSTILNYVQKGDITENNLGAYLNAELDFGKFRFNPSVRIDNFAYTYLDHLSTEYSKTTASRSIVSPKVNVFYNYSKDLQFYTKLGKGFHSNDARTFINAEDLKTIPSAYGYDIGTIYKPVPSVMLNVAYWSLYLEQEFVYVGDAGVVEPSGESLRRGFDLSIRYQPLKWLFFNADANYTIARSLNVDKNEAYIPLAPDLTIKSGLTVKHSSGLNGSFDVRHVNNRPANEDYSIVAEGYTIADLSMSYSFSNLTIGFQIQNLFNSEWNETQFATESRLFDEAESVEEIHFTPGTPFFGKGIIEYRF